MAGLRLHPWMLKSTFSLTPTTTCRPLVFSKPTDRVPKAECMLVAVTLELFSHYRASQSDTVGDVTPALHYMTTIAFWDIQQFFPDTITINLTQNTFARTVARNVPTSNPSRSFKSSGGLVTLPASSCDFASNTLPTGKEGGLAEIRGSYYKPVTPTYLNDLLSDWSLRGWCEVCRMFVYSHAGPSGRRGCCIYWRLHRASFLSASAGDKAMG
jgi:hypothetical protein